MTNDPVNEMATALERIYRRLALFRDAAMQHSPKEVELMLYVDEHGPSRQKDMAAALGLPAATVSWTVDRMAQNKLFRRKPDADDRRAVRVELTAAGRRAVEAQRDVFRRLAELAEATVPAREIGALRNVLRRLSEEG